jgi:hypothetical protein
MMRVAAPAPTSTMPSPAVATIRQRITSQRHEAASLN